MMETGKMILLSHSLSFLGGIIPIIFNNDALITFKGVDIEDTFAT